MKKYILSIFSVLIFSALFSLRAYAGCAPGESYVVITVNSDAYFTTDPTVITVTIGGVVAYVGTPPNSQIDFPIVDGCFPEGAAISIDYTDAFGDGTLVDPVVNIVLGCNLAPSADIMQPTAAAGNIFMGTVATDFDDNTAGTTGSGGAIGTSNPASGGVTCPDAVTNTANFGTIALSPTLTNNTSPPGFPSGITGYPTCDAAGGATFGQVLTGPSSTSGETEPIEVCATYTQPNVSGNETGVYVGVLGDVTEIYGSTPLDMNGDGNGVNDCGFTVTDLTILDAGCNVVASNVGAAGATGLTPGTTYTVCATVIGSAYFQGADGLLGTGDDGAPADGTCVLTQIGLAVQPFESACAITPDPAINIVCDDAGTPFDPSDDTFSFDILVNGENTAGTNTFNDDQGGAAIAYGTTVTYGPFLISAGAATITFTDTDDPNCMATMMGAPPATCSTATCTITPDAASNIVCDDAGTPFDDTDDTFTFDIVVNGDNTDPAATDMFSDDQGNTGAYGSTQSYGPFPIAGGAIVVTFTDVDAPATAACTATMMGTPPATCSTATCTITPDAATNVVCDDAGTPFDDTDDTFTFDIVVNGDNTDPAATDMFSDDQGNTGAYGSTQSYGPFPIAGGAIVVTFTDVDAPATAACTATMMGTPPATCSTATCTITPDVATNIVCDDNGTPADPSDDTFTFDILVNGSNTDAAASNTFNDDQGNNGVAYGATTSYGPFPIAGGPITVMFTDADAPAAEACTATMMANPPATCSGATCTITPDPAANIVCDDNGTPADPSDDTYTFDITVNGSSTFPGATNTFNDDQGNAGIAYGMTVSYGPFPIAGGNVTVMFTDADEATCTGMMMANPPATCSGATCTITPDPAANIVCDDNGTPADPSDDTYTFDITVNGSSTFPGATNTFNDDQGNAGIAYGMTVSYGPFPIAGGNVTVMFTDADEATCTGMMMATAPATCSDQTACMITPDPAASILCNDNGTPSDPSDDTYTFDITVNGSNLAPGASNTFNDDQGNVGIAYGTTVSYGPYPISGGNIIVTFTDVDDPANCTNTMMAAAPPTCSAQMTSIDISDPCSCDAPAIPQAGCTSDYPYTAANSPENIDVDGDGLITNNGLDLVADVIEIAVSSPIVGETFTVAAAGTALNCDGTPILVGDAMTETAPGSGVYQIVVYYPADGSGYGTMMFDADMGSPSANITNPSAEYMPCICEPCVDDIAGSITLADCDFSSTMVEIYDDGGLLVEAVTADMMGNYSLTGGPYACGTYTAVIVNAPACYIEAGGDVGPRAFNVDGDGTPDGFNFMGPVANIPTVGEWGLIILGLLMCIMAVVSIRQRIEEENQAWG